MGEQISKIGMKRLFDLVVGAVFFWAASPLMLLIAILIWLDSGRPIFFVQERAGYKGKPFRMLKFRTLRKDAPSPQQSFIATRRGERFFCDPLGHEYATRVGKLLRTSYLNELPQLWNVVRGDMSLVGPRPVFPADLPLLGRHANAICSVRPGLTGLSQVKGRWNHSIPEVIESDLEYIKKQGFWYDLRLLLLTPAAVLRRHGAS